MEEHLQEGTIKQICNDRIWIRKLHNFGLAGGYGKGKRLLVIGAPLLFWTGCLVHFISLLKQQGNTAEKAGLAMILGGGASNLVDRIRQGYVTDYFSFHVPWKRIQRLVFNLSDMFIFLGVLLSIPVQVWKNK